MPTINPDDTSVLFPLPNVTSIVRGHSPQADAAAHHGVSIVKGWLPHSHVILEDMPFEQKQKLGNHMEIFHSPDWRAYNAKTVVD